MQVTSPDISVLDYALLFDISGAAPSVRLTNQSTETNPAALLWVFEIYSPSGTPIHKGSFTAPDVNGTWSTPFTKNTNFPRPYNQIEWSGAPYKIIVRVKDSNGEIFEDTTYVRVCPPGGNTKDSKNTYGTASVKLITRCREAKLWAEDSTAYVYNGKQGIVVSKTFNLFFPPNEETGVPQDPVVFSNFNTALIPIAQSGSGYLYHLASVMDYALDERVTVRVKYLKKENFNVYCNLDLSPVACELEKLISLYESGGCKDVADAQKKITLISAKLHIANSGISFPQSGIDPYAKVEEINKLTGWNCNCCATGITPNTLISGAQGDFELVFDGGDINGSIEEVGSTLRFHFSDFSYVLAINPTNQGWLSVDRVIAGNTKTDTLLINETVLVDELLTVIEGNTSYKNRLNALITSNVSAGVISIDPKCVLPQSRTFSYTFVTPTIASGATYFLFSIVVNGVQKNINFLFDRTNVADLVTALNALNVGTFSAYFSADVLTITSASNPYVITSFVGKHSAGNNAELQMTKVTNDLSTYTISQVAQGIIDYVCGFILARVQAGQGYSIKMLDAVGGAITTLNVNPTDSAADLMAKFIQSYNGLVEIVRLLKQTDCETVKALFTPATVMSDAAILYGTENNMCVGYPMEVVAAKVLKMAQNIGPVKTEFCAAQQQCGQAICEPVTNAVATYNAGTSTLEVEITNTGALKYRVGYRMKAMLSEVGGGTFFYNILGPLNGIKEITPTGGATSTTNWTGVAPGQYDVVVVPICANGTGAEYVATTTPCAPITQLTAIDNTSTIDVTFGGIPSSAVKVRIEVEEPHGGSYAANYALTPTTISLAKPVPGTYRIRAYAVCNEAQNWYSVPTADVLVDVAPVGTCPGVTDVKVTSITTTGATITATKPAGTLVNFYRLTLTPQDGSAPIVQVSNTPGATVTWVVNTLISMKTYHVHVESVCANGASNPYNYGNFTTAGSLNSTIHNDTAVTPAYVTVKVNNTVVYASDALAPTVVDNYSTVAFEGMNTTVTITPCCDCSTTASVISNGVTYSSFVKVGQSYIFTGVQIVGGIEAAFGT